MHEVRSVIALVALLDVADCLLLLGGNARAAPARHCIVSMQEAPTSGMRRRNVGSSGVVVSELGLGTQRWGSTDFNAPDEATCHAMLDLATANGVNLVDTAGP
jgi:hypothetical protein